MPGIIVSDTSCLILLNKLGRIELLEFLFGAVTITDIVANEYGEKLPGFIKIENPKDKNYQRIFETFLGKGEASSLALSLEKDNCLLILDDLKLRKEAKKPGLRFTGSIGILILAEEKGYIANMKQLVQSLKETNFRISKKYMDILLAKGKH